MDPSHIGARLRAIRTRLGWSRETLAHHSGVSWSAIAQIESGRRRDVRLSSLSALAEALGVSVDYLIGSATATVPQLFEHRLLTYTSDEEYLASVIPFFVEGMERSESLLAVTTEEKTWLLRGSLADRADVVEYADSAEWYRSIGTALDGYHAFVDRKLRAGAAWIRIVGELPAAKRSDAEMATWNRYESFVNIAFASRPATILCSYDDRSWPAEVIAGARLTHPEVAHGSESSVNPSYREPEDFLIS